MKFYAAKPTELKPVKEKPLRICGIPVHLTGETQYCKHCEKETPTLKSIKITIRPKEYIGVYCSVCNRMVTCYPIKRGEK